MNENANANTQICVFECIRMRIPNTNTPCLITRCCISPMVYCVLRTLLNINTIPGCVRNTQLKSRQNILVEVSLRSFIVYLGFYPLINTWMYWIWI